MFPATIQRGGNGVKNTVIANITSAYTVQATDNGTTIRTSSGTGAITLLSCQSVGVGFSFNYINATSGSVSISRVGADTFSNAATALTITPGQEYRFTVSDAASSGVWQVSQVGINGTGNGSVAIAGGTANSTGALSIGVSSQATATSAVSLGNSAIASAASALSLGVSTSATSTYASAIGSNSSAQASVANTGSGAMALGGSYASGVDSFAAANADNSGTYGAQGANSVALGKQTKATAANAKAFATTSTASGANSTVLGLNASAAQTGKLAHGITQTSALGDAQFGLIVLKATTTGTAVVMTSDGSAAGTSNQLIVASNQVMAFTGTLIGKQTGSANIAAYTITATLVNNAGTVTMPTGTLTLIGSDSITLTAAPTLAADNTNKGLTVTSGNKTATNINWVCSLLSSELIFA